jgi:hypothetical protein
MVASILYGIGPNESTMIRAVLKLLKARELSLLTRQLAQSVGMDGMRVVERWG